MNKLEIEYSIVSRGTEKYNNTGYMAISKIINSYRYIVNENHNVKELNMCNAYLKAKSIYEISNIVFSRFELITAMMFDRHQKEIEDNILITGLGNVGITCLFYLLDNGYKNISIFIKKNSKRVIKLFSLIKREYNIDLNFISKLSNTYKTYIDTTGNSKILEDIFCMSSFNNTIIILSTPRDEKYLISPLMVNRKNLTIIGGHEFNGILDKDRQDTYNRILDLNINKKYLSDLINIYAYSKSKLEKIKLKKLNFIEIFCYSEVDL